MADMVLKMLIIGIKSPQTSTQLNLTRYLSNRFHLVGKNQKSTKQKGKNDEKSYLTAFVKEFLRLPTTMATSSRLTSSTSTTSLAHAEAEAGGEDTVAKELGGRTKPRLISLSMRSTCLLFNWFFLELFLDKMESPKDAKLELLLSLLSVLLNCF